MKKIFIILFVMIVLSSCGKQEEVGLSQQPEPEEIVFDEEILPIHEASTDVEIEFSQALNSLLNEIVNEE